MPRRRLALLALLALPLLLAAVVLVWAQTYPAPVAASMAKAALAGCCDVGIASAADLSSEEPEPLQATAPAAPAAAQRGPWRVAASSATPLRAPDEPLRPPKTRPRV